MSGSLYMRYLDLITLIEIRNPFQSRHFYSNPQFYTMSEVNLFSDILNFSIWKRMKYLLLIILICRHFLNVNGNFQVEINSWMTDERLSVRSKLIIDIIESKGLNNIIFIASDNNMEEIVKISSLLQINATITLTILHYHELVIYYLYSIGITAYVRPHIQLSIFR